MCVIVLFSSFLHARVEWVCSSYLIKKPWNVRSVRWHILSMRRWKKSVWDDEDMNSWRLSPEIPQLLWVIVGSGWCFTWFPALFTWSSKNKVKNNDVNKNQGKNTENWLVWPQKIQNSWNLFYIQFDKIFVKNPKIKGKYRKLNYLT